MEDKKELNNEKLNTINGGAMKNKRYHSYYCNSCTHKWGSANDESECPECHSTNIRDFE